MIKKASLCLILSAFFCFDVLANDDTLDYKIVVKKLDNSRNNLYPEIGVSSYRFDSSSIEDLPNGAFTPLNQVLLRSPSVTQGTNGEVYIRGEHRNAQYRINGVIIPEGISGFGDSFDANFIDSMDVNKGALPAQYGYRNGAVIDIKTKTGAIGNGGRTSVMAGSNATTNFNQQFFGSTKNADFYLSATFNKTDLGTESPSSRRKQLNNELQADKQFAYASYLLDPQNRLSLIFGNSTNRYEVPSAPNQEQHFEMPGVSGVSSQNTYQRQFERNTYAIAAIQGSDTVDYQFAVFAKRSSVLFKPDYVGDLLFSEEGMASRDSRTNYSTGFQNDYSYTVSDTSTLRAGLFYLYDDTRASNNSLVFPDSAFVTPTNPIQVNGSESKHSQFSSVYVQHEVRPFEKLLVNYGARFDDYNAYLHESQLSPRVGAVYDATKSTKIHAGYARYLTPPSSQFIKPVMVSKLAGTTAESEGELGSLDIKSERSHYFDVGVVQKIGDGWSLSLSAYYKIAKNMLDQGAFDHALMATPFNYKEGYAKGIEVGSDYSKDNLNFYVNLSVSDAKGKGIGSGLSEFDGEEASYIENHYVNLDHQQRIAGSAGISYKLLGTKYSADAFYGSGLSRGFASKNSMPSYTQVNLSASEKFTFKGIGDLDVKLSLINLFDNVYAIRDGSGIGVSSPKYGPRRGAYVTVSKSFGLK